MSHAKFENFTNQRALEKWARKEREKRLDILLAIHYLDNKLAEEIKYLTDIPRQREEYEVIYGTRRNAECHITSIL